ncbi:hypothetical protein Patl1_02560 [Pistacia atlantica]|uniref:Uncharacterized protein n=1 Tax=Pistacia atlantica TaxID=434234 RepID=A0ACC1C6I9_9ROSI|nr:hypothetical protein Patl1_02560 [Pistacia atlantica]
MTWQNVIVDSLALSRQSISKSSKLPKLSAIVPFPVSNSNQSYQFTKLFNLSYHRPPNDPYASQGYSAPYPPPPPYEGYPPPLPPPGFPNPPPGQCPYEGYQGYFAEGYPPPPPRAGQPQYYYEHYHYQNNDTGCTSFLQGWYVYILLSFIIWDSC